MIVLVVELFELLVNREDNSSCMDLLEDLLLVEAAYRDSKTIKVSRSAQWFCNQVYLFISLLEYVA